MRAHTTETLPPHSFKPDIFDKFVVFESMVLCLTLTSSWRVCFDLIWAQGAALEDTSAEALAHAGGVLSVILIILQVVIIMKFYLRTHAFMAKDEEDNWDRYCTRKLGVHENQDQLAYRLRFTMKRFTSDQNRLLFDVGVSPAFADFRQEEKKLREKLTEVKKS